MQVTHSTDEQEGILWHPQENDGVSRMYVEPINVSNTTLSTFEGNRHRKFDAKQTKRHSFGQAHCVVCDKVFTKYQNNTLVCSRECKRKRNNAYSRKYREKNREILKARLRKYREENREKILAQKRKYYEKKCKDPEWVKKENAIKRKWREENPEKVQAYARKRWRTRNDRLNY